MREPSRTNTILICKLAWQWISYMQSGRGREAERMLAPDCGLLGVQTTKHSSIFLPVLSLKWLPRLRVLRIYSVDSTVALHVALADNVASSKLYRVYFRFCFAKIAKIDLSALINDWKLPFEQKQFSIPLEEVIFNLR